MDATLFLSMVNDTNGDVLFRLGKWIYSDLEAHGYFGLLLCQELCWQYLLENRSLIYEIMQKLKITFLDKMPISSRKL
jgi:hypothetical protein